MAKLTPKQKAFAAEYLVDLNAAAAATRAGYSERTARAKGYVLLQNPDIQAEIRAGMENRAKRLEISQDMVIQELARIAFFNATRAARVVNNQYGAQVEFTADDQALSGKILVDTISTLNLTLKNGSSFTGTINIASNAEGSTAVSDNAVVTIGSGCTWTLTGDCAITSLTNNGTINFNGYTITLADGTVLR